MSRKTQYDETPTVRSHPWLPAVVPATAHRFRVHEHGLRSLLAEAGAELVESDPDTEIGDVGRLVGDAPHVIVALGGHLFEGGPRQARALQRIKVAASLRGAARRTTRNLRRVGYPRGTTVTWEPGGRLGGGRFAVSRRRRGVTGRFPLGVLVVGERAAASRTYLEAARDEADPNADWSGRVAVGTGSLISIGDTGVLRVAIGAGRREIRANHDALQQLAAADPPREVADRVPWPISTGSNGLAEWSFERRLHGIPASHRLGVALQADCVDFLVELFRSRTSVGAVHRFDDDAEVVASACCQADRRTVVELARRLDVALAGVPCGFGHGDFWSGNLIVRGGRLVGVVDWDAASPGRLPLLDLFHLRLSAAARRTGREIGPVLLEERTRPGADWLTASYLARIGLEASSDLLECLLLAYWLDYVSYQMRSFIDARERPQWFHENVEVVLHALGSGLQRSPLRAA